MQAAESAGPRPRLLYLCQQNPWRLTGGGLIRNYWIASALADRFDVDLVTADDDVAPPHAYARRFRSIRSFPRPRGGPARVRRALEALRPRASLLTAGTVTRALRDYVATTASTIPYAAVMFDLNMLEALPADVPRFYHAHNCETALLERRAAIETMPARLAVTLDARRLRRIETQVLRDARLIVACSQSDVADLHALAATPDRTAVVPNGVDVASYASLRDERPAERTAIITGSYDWRPNQLGLDWFLRAVFPHLETIAAGRPFSIRVAGRMSADYARKIASVPSLVAVPNPADMKAELARASVVVAPILASSGTRLRILEAWAAGRPVVTTPEGAFGLPFTDGDDLIVRDASDPEAFARALWTVLDDPDRQRRIADAAFARALAFDWSALGKNLTGEVARALGRH